MARFAAVAALLLIAAAIVLAAAAPINDETRGQATVERPGEFPPLSPPEDVAPATGPAVLPLGLYPALSAQRGIALPSSRALRVAERFASSREGTISFAVLGGGGQVLGVRADEQFESASLIKAMILVAYLRKLAAEGREPTELELQRMDDMIRVSDNFSASDLFDDLGPEGLDELAAEAGMQSFVSNEFWGNCLVTAGDQVRFFLQLDRLLPAEDRAFARDLLENVASFHAWGIPQAARPAWRVYFKGGWRPDETDGQIVHQAALLERGTSKLAIAVMTSQDPSEVYGQETIQGIAKRVLSTGVRPGVLAPVPALEGFQAPEPKPLRPAA